MPGARYSTAFKEKMVAKLLHPKGPSMWALSQESGVTYTTLSRWMAEARKLPSMKKQNSRTRKRWTTEDKLRIVARANELSDKDLGAFLRREGVHTQQLDAWREAIHSGFGEPLPEARRQSRADRKRIRDLERELRRKEKALAEAAALVWLKKKAREIWGDEDGDTPSKSDE